MQPAGYYAGVGVAVCQGEAVAVSVPALKGITGSALPLAVLP